MVLLLSALKKIIIIPYYTQRKLPTTCLYSIGHAITANKQDLLSDVCTSGTHWKYIFKNFWYYLEGYSLATKFVMT